MAIQQIVEGVEEGYSRHEVEHAGAYRDGGSVTRREKEIGCPDYRRYERADEEYEA